jgi:hypothetical protein
LDSVGRRLIGLYELISVDGFPGLGIIMIWAYFHCTGKWEYVKILTTFLSITNYNALLMVINCVHIDILAFSDATLTLPLFKLHSFSQLNF